MSACIAAAVASSNQGGLGVQRCGYLRRRDLQGCRRLLFLCLLLVGSQAHLSWADAQGQVTTALIVRGSVEHELTLSVDDLKRFPVQRVDDVRTGSPGAAAGSEVMRRYAGCLLRDVLDRAGPVESHRFDMRRSIVIATASDGYRAVFSWAELYLSPVGEGVLIVYERDGAPLSDDEGRIALLSLKDSRPGPRHVKWLRAIELRTLAD
jgi:DMSO/TMAO reductase YedYZ molybdopterin-dependent catalytic subunit